MKISPHIHTLFLQKITGLTKNQLFLNPLPNPLPVKEKKLYSKYLQRYNDWEPLEYILESAEFYGHRFFVDQRVLIPRNDTEVMVSEAIKKIDTQIPSAYTGISPLLKGENSDIIYIDVGTGSGCIPISVIKVTETPPSAVTPLKKRRSIDCYAIDISKKALEVANINIQKYDLEENITLLWWNLLEPMMPLLDGEKWETVIITANLPYIKQDDFENMDSSVYNNEPASALYGWENTGFELYEELMDQCQQLVAWQYAVTLFIEIGFDQIGVCREFLERRWYEYKVFRDNGWVERCVRIEISR